MSTSQTYLAVDLGAGSGRVIAAIVDNGRMRFEEMARFENRGVDLPSGSFWNLLGLYREILDGLRAGVAKFGDSIVSIGIDTWGCDFGYVDADGELLGLPHQYRDPRFEGMADAMHAILPETEVYARTGIKTNFYNSSLHLLAEARRNSVGMANAANLLFIPDLLSFFLTGRRAVERTNASTSQLLDARTGEWAGEVIDALKLPRKIFGEIVAPGTVLGPVRDEVETYIGKTIPVVATASHDTAAAVAGIPMQGHEKLWLSSGTWSIMGVETPTPVTTPEALAYGFCNELGVENSVRFLKNIGGLWLIQECKRQWDLDGEGTEYATMAKAAADAPAFTAFIDPDDAVFASPGNMPQKICDACAASGQPVPSGQGAILRVATESLALKYRVVFERVCELTGRRYARLNAGGGGIQNELLCQATANALGIPVTAGPIEATSCGNVITQMVAMKSLADIAAGRELIRSSFDFKTYEPQDREAWEAAYARFRTLLKI